MSAEDYMPRRYRNEEQAAEQTLRDYEIENPLDWVEEIPLPTDDDFPS